LIALRQKDHQLIDIIHQFPSYWNDWWITVSIPIPAFDLCSWHMLLYVYDHIAQCWV